MSPFSHLGEAINPGGAIDRNFSPLLNLIDEFDRHFSRHHRFTNCLIPRFDIEEDHTAYYLTGELAGATVSDIAIEAHDDHTLVISGNIPSTLSMAKSLNGSHVEILEGGKGYIDHDIFAQDTSKAYTEAAPTSKTANGVRVDGSNGKTTAGGGGGAANGGVDGSRARNGERQTLQSERLAGEFHRRFTFSYPFIEGRIKASADNGVLYVVVPKLEPCLGKERKKIPVVSGKHGMSGISGMYAGV